MTATNDNGSQPVSQHPGQRRLEQLAFGAAGSATVSDADRRHCEECERCRARIDRLLSEREAFLQERPAEEFVERIVMTQSQRRPRRGLLERFPAGASLTGRLVPIAAVLLVAIGLSAFFLLRTGLSPDTGPENHILFKGDADLRLELFVSRGGEPATPHGSDEPLIEGDILRFGVLTRTDGYLFIANIDDKGRTTTYYPQGTRGDTRIAAGEMQLPVETIVLNDFVGDELIAAILTEEPLSEAEVFAALKRAYADKGGALDRIRTLDLKGIFALKIIHKATP